MKKYTSALALAAILGVPAAASAQTEIRPYLTADVSLGFDVGGDNLFTSGDDVDYVNGSLVTSAYGLRASHDLGNGLTAHGQLEGDFNTATGDVLASGAFRRGANVGISGGFGRFDFGTKANPFTGFHGRSYAMGGNTVASNTASTMGFGNFFTQRAITYSTPKLGGFSAQLQYGFEDARTSPTPFGEAHESVIAGYASYEIAGFTIGAAAMDKKGIIGDEDETTWMAAISYKLGALQLNAAWVDNDDVGAAGQAADDNTLWQVGLKYTVSPQLEVGGNYLEHDSGSFMANFQARYALTKNVVAYGMVNHIDNDAGGASFLALNGTGSRGDLEGVDGTAIATGLIVSF